MDLSPGLRDNHCRGALFGEAEIFVSELVSLVAQAAGHNRAHLVESFKRFANLASRSRFDRFSIPLDSLALIKVPSECRVLATNLMELYRLHAGMALDGKQGI